jgi:hypothetical protein
MPIAPIGPAAAAARPQPVASPPRTFGAALEARGVAPGSRGAPRPLPAAPHRPPLPAALGAVERAQARLDAVLSAARSGRTFSAGELLGLQAEAYRTAQTVDLAAKLVEQGAQSVKQALNTQV